MAGVDFVIPLSRDDLLTRTSVQQYVVDEVLPLRLLPAKLQACKLALRGQGPLCILQHFDTLFSVLKSFHTVELEVKEDAWDFITKVVGTYSSQLVDYLDQTSLDQDTRQQHLAAVKMSCYMLCQFIDAFETEVTSTTLAGAGRGKQKKCMSISSAFGAAWEMEREKGVRILQQLIRLPLNRLWQPPVAEDDFVNLVANSCYKLLENPGVSKVAGKPTRDTILQLLGVLVRRYNHGLGCGLKILQMLQHFEHLASTMAQGMQLFMEEFGVKSMLPDVIREVSRMDPHELARDTSGTRAYAAFLMELSERIPLQIMPSMVLLMELLDAESYSMRNCVLSMLGEMVVRVLSREDLDEKMRATREQYLDKLEDHLHDVNAFVRSKVLQIWLHIIAEKAVPLPRQHNLLALVIGRLKDKSSNVRKYAIQTVTALLRTNPFAAKLAVEELQLSYETEKAKLKDMMPDEPEPESHADRAKLETETSWAKIEEGLHEAVHRALAQEGTDENADGGQDAIGDEETLDSVKIRIVNLVKEESFAAAVKLYQAARQAWPQDAAFAIVTRKSPEMDDDDEVDQKPEDITMQEIKLIFFGEQLHSNIVQAVAAGSQPVDPEKQVQEQLLAKQQTLVMFLKNSMGFIQQYHAAIPVLAQLLGSKNISDVLESIDFFVTAFEFGMTSAMIGIRKMLVLVWSREAGIKDAVVGAYKRLYLSGDGHHGNMRTQALAVANNLTALTSGATVGDLTSLEELISELVKSRDLNGAVIQVLWEQFSLKIPGTTNSDSRGALILLAMAAGAQVEIVRSNIDVLVREGLGERAERDFLLARDTCNALLKLVPNGRKVNNTEEPFRLPQDHAIFTQLLNLVVSGVTQLDQRHWVPMAESAINVIYKLSEHPDAICGEMMKKLAAAVMAQGTLSAAKPTAGQEDGQKDGEENGQAETAVPSSPTPTASTEPTSPQPSTSQTIQDPLASQTAARDRLMIPSGLLTRLLTAAGHIAMRQLVHLDVSMFGELRRRQNVKEEQGNKRRSLGTPAAKPSANKKKQKAGGDAGPEELSLEEELGLCGATADDGDSDYIRKITERDLVTGNNLLSVLCPLIVTVCKNQNKYPDPELQAAASLALAKYMCVSSEFCEQHLQILFTLLEKSPHAVIRANTIIACGDLTFRFPNLIEPWTPNLYARLRDDSATVRKNTCMVLTHLILNDMVKVKGQISELASCIVDHDSRIANLSKLFFSELSKKGNAVYNIMPDMVSRLSDPDIGVPEESFRAIMKYLFLFIQKDKQCESLVEKLCHRFRSTTNERQWRDLSFCLSLLSYNEKSLGKLQVNFGCFADKLGDDEIYDHFVTVMTNAKKFAKQETKTVIDELENLMEQCHNKGMEDAATANKASRAAAAARSRKGHRSPGKHTPGKKTPAKTPGRGKSRALSQRQVIDSDVEAGEFNPAKRGARQKPKMSFDSSDEDSDELFVPDKGKKRQHEMKSEASDASDGENSNPNATESTSPPRTVKKKASVNNTQSQWPKSQRTTRRTART